MTQQRIEMRARRNTGGNPQLAIDCFLDGSSVFYSKVTRWG